MNNPNVQLQGCNSFCGTQLSIGTQLQLSSSICYQSLGQYGVHSELQMDLLDIPISIYDVVSRCYRVRLQRGKWLIGRCASLTFRQCASLASCGVDCV